MFKLGWDQFSFCFGRVNELLNEKLFDSMVLPMSELLRLGVKFVSIINRLVE